MNSDKLDKRKVRRLKRRATLRERRLPVGYGYEMDKNDAKIILDAVFSYINDHRNEPRMKLCTVSRDQGKTWTNENINVAVTDPNLSTLKVGDLVRETGDGPICVIVANEGENQIHGAFQDDPDSPFFLPEGHLYRNALPYT
ncbi:hypothetical protein [Paenibacillus sp. LHD-38]|uniref:hypothetical protein n=1 Tax=Paenibacillus sp. LHD-38 TaxID=3072143 RepID=UPI00280E098B|nr:hypothetical protein [Paenibacillus sp. LHD-38]MDQ8739332.1 hypothetical protein [Paenibacillus sp. LHD-38]